MAHIHNFEIKYGTKTIECMVDMETDEIEYSVFPTKLTTKQQQILNSLFSMLITLHKEFGDYQKLECNEP